MAGGPEDPVASGAMEISPGLDAVPARPDTESADPSAVAPVEPDEEITAEQVSLSRRLRQPRTIISILIPLVIIAAFIGINGAALAKVPGLIAGANPVLVAAAFGIFYLGFPLRGWRWKALLRGTDFIIGTKDSTVIIFLSWLVNCVVPAKLGDLYRAYLLKMNSTASLSRTFGTVFIERILDIFAIAMLGHRWPASGASATACRRRSRSCSRSASCVVVVLAVGLFTMRNFGRRILIDLPLPHRVIELYDRFEEGVFGALRLRQLPFLGTVTGLIWMTESLRLYFVVLALGLPRRRARALGRGVRGPHRFAADGGPAQPGRARVRRGRRHRRPDRGLRRAAPGGHRDRAPGLGDQRLLDHRVRRRSPTSFSPMPRGHGPDPAARRRPSHRSTRAQV